MTRRLKLFLIKLLTRLGLSSGLGLRFTVVHSGKRIRVPMVDGIGLEHASLPDPHLLPVLGRAVGLRKGAFVDVGAHIGETLVKLLATGHRRPYVGFEPQARAAAYLQRLLEANAYEGEVIAAALGDRNGVAGLRLSRALDDSATMIEGFRGDQGDLRRQVIPVIRGDDALDGTSAGHVGVLKIDAEGAEAEVLTGFTETIERDRPVILCEVLPVYDEATPTGRLRRERSDFVAGFAGEHRYRLLRIRGFTLEQVDRIETHSDLSLRDYLFVPVEEDASLLMR
jgi:FkbM family methyltransferase